MFSKKDYNLTDAFRGIMKKAEKNLLLSLYKKNDYCNKHINNTETAWRIDFKHLSEIKYLPDYCTCVFHCRHSEKEPSNVNNNKCYYNSGIVNDCSIALFLNVQCFFDYLAYSMNDAPSYKCPISSMPDATYQKCE